MGADFYTEDYLQNGGGGGGSYYDGGGDWGFDTTSWPTFSDYYGTSDIGAGGDFNYGYGAEGFDYGGEGDYYGLPTEPGSYGSDGNLFYDYFSYYTDLGYDLNQAADLAMQAASEGSIQTLTTEQGTPTFAPYQQYWPIEEPQYFPLPVAPIEYAQYQQSWPIEHPGFEPFPAPPPQQPNLPPACPTGQYHPYPIGHPQQNVCVPFQLQPPRAPAPPQIQPPPAPKPPSQQQQQCPQGYYRDPQTGQCKPIPSGQPQSCPSGYYRASNGQCLPIPKCTTPGTVFDQARGICIPKAQAVSPLPEGAEGLFGDLKNIPWWAWLAGLGALLLLGKDNDDGRKTTVTYRRAR